MPFLFDLRRPNNLTIFRIVAVPLIVLALMRPDPLFCVLAAILFSLAAITDYLDGYLARRLNMVTSFGKIMDPLADKLLVTCTFIMLAAHGRAPAWVVCIIVGREIAITGLRNFMVGGKADVSASNLGKYKTGFQIAAAIPLLFHYPYLGINLHAIGMFFLWGALVFTVWSGLDYFIRYRDLLNP